MELILENITAGEKSRTHAAIGVPGLAISIENLLKVQVSNGLPSLGPTPLHSIPLRSRQRVKEI